MTINSRNLLLAFAVLLTACSPYDDGPSISFRSKGMRMNWERPISYYESGGIDSTSAIIQLFQDSIVGFDGEVISSWDSPSD